jgi:hypothetical protein
MRYAVSFSRPALSTKQIPHPSLEAYMLRAFVGIMLVAALVYAIPASIGWLLAHFFVTHLFLAYMGIIAVIIVGIFAMYLDIRYVLVRLPRGAFRKA